MRGLKEKGQVPLPSPNLNSDYSTMRLASRAAAAASQLMRTANAAPVSQMILGTLLLIPVRDGFAITKSCGVTSQSSTGEHT